MSNVNRYRVVPKAKPAKSIGAHSDGGPASGFVDGGTDVLDAELRAPDHRCGAKVLDSTQAGDRYTCDECAVEYVFSSSPFRQWLPYFESTGQRPHARSFKGGTADAADTIDDDSRGAGAEPIETY